MGVVKKACPSRLATNGDENDDDRSHAPGVRIRPEWGDSERREDDLDNGERGEDDRDNGERGEDDRDNGEWIEDDRDNGERGEDDRDNGERSEDDRDNGERSEDDRSVVERTVERGDVHVVTVRRATDEDLDRWNRFVERSPAGTCFHEHEALVVQAEHAGATLHPLVGYKGQEPVGVFPVFEVRKGPVRTAFSPPPHLRVPYLGPACLNLEKLSQRKREKRRERFLEGCLEWIDEELSPKYAHVRTAPAFDDPRTFVWGGHDVTPEYTYHVDLSVDEETLLGRFSGDARRNVRNTPDDAYTIEEGGLAEIHAIVDQVRERYESQGVDFDVQAAFVEDLYEHLEGGHIRPYVCRVDGEFVGGILAAEYGGTIGRWMGGVRTDRGAELPTNDLLDWHVMADGLERGLSTYDLVGGQTQRINRYKAKFDPTLVPYYSIERSKWGMGTIAHLYNAVK